MALSLTGMVPDVIFRDNQGMDPAMVKFKLAWPRLYIIKVSTVNVPDNMVCAHELLPS